MEGYLAISLETHPKMLKNIKGLMLSRVIILTLLLTIPFLFQISEKKYFFISLTNDFYYFLSLFYLITIIYALLFKKIKNLYWFAIIQITIDHLFITALIYFTGGKDSFFPMTYIFSIIGSSMVFYKRGAFFSASLSSLLYSLLLLLQLLHWINPIGQTPIYDASQVFYSVILYMAAFYIVAFLSSTISEELKKKKKELSQKEADYNQLEAFNRNIIQSLDSGLLTIDLTGRINFLNRTAEKILGRSGEELMNLSIYDLFPQIQEVIHQGNKKVLEPLPSYQRYETILSSPNGKKIHLGFSISPLTDPEGSMIGHTLIFQDITKFKEMEEQMKRFDTMAAIGVLAAGMAHEIRNPLACLSGSIQMLKSELTLDESQMHLMEITLRESERLNALITDFLLFAQPPQTHKEPWDIERIVKETVELFVHSPYFHDDIRVHQSSPNGAIWIPIDPDQMKQVFLNLFINAAQAMTHGGELRIQLEKGDNRLWGTALPILSGNQDKQWVKISITDDGNGISSEEKEKIFEPFFTTKETGTGLGLSIVHKIIENHHGFIKVESEIGKGSTFTLFLPAD